VQSRLGLPGSQTRVIPHCTLLATLDYAVPRRPNSPMPLLNLLGRAEDLLPRHLARTVCVATPVDPGGMSRSIGLITPPGPVRARACKSPWCARPGDGAADVVAVLEPMRRERVPEVLAGDAFGQAGTARGI